ncbi:hypothetical protein [Rickettsia endosymbiont of Oedothorax gibbosus]|uniref:hypothetical protein n=1 Tax=Rickettsia endosymbiont of Oedothorax gibbosus TaxID=931099 RepID=UPI002024A6BF|nr:hypothetical protein [Rickettsia endosymbiont of Oedothorax gibbosus]
MSDDNDKWFKKMKANLAKEGLPEETSTTTFGLPNEQYKEWVAENTKCFKEIKEKLAQEELAKSELLENHVRMLSDDNRISEISKSLFGRENGFIDKGTEAQFMKNVSNYVNVKCWGASSAVSSPVTTEPKVSSDAISNSDNKETDSTDTVSEITVVTELASDREDSSIILPPSENADNTNELESEDESYDDLVSSSDESNIDIPKYTEVEPTGSLKGVESII